MKIKDANAGLVVQVRIQTWIIGAVGIAFAIGQLVPAVSWLFHRI